MTGRGSGPHKNNKKPEQAFTAYSGFMVRAWGVEPQHITAREPKSRMSTNSIMPAYKTKKPIAVTIGSIWSGLRGSNSLPPPWQGGALPDELKPHQQCLFILPHISYLSSPNVKFFTLCAYFAAQCHETCAKRGKAQAALRQRYSSPPSLKLSVR